MHRPPVILHDPIKAHFGYGKYVAAHSSLEMDWKKLRRSLDAFRRSPEFGVFQLNEYILAFRSSSDRARYVIFIATAISLLILISDWNYLSWSWSRQAANSYKIEHLDLLSDEWSRAREDAKQQQKLIDDAEVLRQRLNASPTSDRAAADALRDAAADLRETERELAEKRRSRSRAASIPLDTWLDREWRREWYGGQTQEFYGRSVFVPVPGLGSSVHINDIALIGGLVLLVISALLWASLVRQHENLYLACFKIHLLCRVEGESKSDRDSIANFVYHALAMAQVLSYPPSLARWNFGWRHRFSGGLVALVYLFPALVQWCVAIQNIRSRTIAYPVWGQDTTKLRLAVQVILAAAITLFCLLACYYARSCNIRWRKTFFVINPGLKRIEQRPWLEWINVADSQMTNDQRSIARELTYTLSVRDPRPDLTEVTVMRNPQRSLKSLDSWHVLNEARRIFRQFVGAKLYRDQYLVTQRELAATSKELVRSAAGDPKKRVRSIEILENKLTVAGKSKVWNVKISVKIPAAPNRR